MSEEKIEAEVVENLRTWPHSGFSVDQSLFLPAGDAAAIERLIQYMTRCPFSLSRLVKVSDTGQVIFQSEKQAFRAFPDPKGDGMRAGVPRNFQILEPLDFLAEFTQQRPSLRSGARPTPGRDTPILLVKWYDFTRWLLERIDSFPKNQRFVFGTRLADHALDVLETLVEASYSRRKTELLSRINRKIEMLSWLVRLAKDRRVLTLLQYLFT